MAFMMPVVKNQYNIYPCRSRKSSTCSNGARSRTVSESAKSTPDVLSTSPQSVVSEPTHSRGHIRYVRSHSQDSNDSASSNSSAGIPTPKSGSISSLQKFHIKLVDKLRRKFKGKNNNADEDEENDHAQTARSSS